MTIISTELRKYLELTYDYKIIGIIDLDWLVDQPRNTLYKLFKQWHKVAFDHNDRIVLYSKNSISTETYIHIQNCGSLIDISNFFILICCQTIDTDLLDSIRQNYSSDDHVFSTLEIDFIDKTQPPVASSKLLLPDTFCFAPWAHMEITSQGEFKPCCVYNEPITDSNRVPYNINFHSIEQVYHSEYLTQLRIQFINGEQPAGCSTCWFKEQHGGKSNRTWIKTYLGVEAECLHVEEDSLNNLKSLDIKLGNLCNFKCRICDANNSSRIAEEQIKHFGSTLDLKNLNQRGQWAKNEHIWKMFEELGGQLINIDFYGGEPFLIKQHEIFLDYLIGNKYAKNIRLHYNSNGSIYPEQLFDKWKFFRQIDIAFSIDNIGPRFELERGGNWHEVEQNLDKFLANKLPNMILSIFPTVNIQNVYYLDQLIAWIESREFNATVWSLLTEPKFLNIVSMNQELTNMVIDRFRQIDQKIFQKYNLLPILKMLEQNKGSSDLVDQLANYMLKLDSIRNQKFEITHAEIANIIYKGKKHGKTI